MKQSDNEPVKYIVAVSGGVDSVVLLHILAEHWPKDRLVVAHFDHGIREDSGEDRAFVERLARIYGLPFVSAAAQLGLGASEAVAREARYAFLRQARQAASADYIVTAHHQDDLLETAIINMLRGTGRKGLSSLRSHGDLHRPLLTTPKAHVRMYARKHGLHWREDSTNADQSYLRNYVRQQIVPRFDAEARQRLLALIWDTSQKNMTIDGLLDGLLAAQGDGAAIPDSLDRRWFNSLPDEVAKEVMAAWLRARGAAGFDRKTLDRLVAGARDLDPGKRLDINGRLIMLVMRDAIGIIPR
jgi:tRNA(Ile)-lysidine synthase